MGLYVETRIIGVDLDTLWQRTQEPAQHQRWDLRFTRIDYLDTDEGAPRRFRYDLRVLPGLWVTGTGVAAGERWRPDGTRTSALRFASPHPLSPLAEGRGYWRYLPESDGVRFLTGYDYAPRWGRLGRLVDRWALRPVMGWATAWSFDRLRLWCEHGLTPERARVHWLLESATRTLTASFALATLTTQPYLALPLLLAALALPPAPGTPAARRCRRRPADTASPQRSAPDTPDAPALLDRLEQP